MNIYYVYAYLRKNDNTPYYIGKGKGKRAWIKSKNERITVPKNKSKIIIYQNNLSQKDAFLLEILYIKLFGRKDLKTGILENRSNGGDAPPNRKGKIVSDDVRKRISESLKGRPSPKKGISLTEDHKSKIKINNGKGMKGRHHSDKTKEILSEKISISNTGREVTVDTRNKISKTLTGRDCYWSKGIPRSEEVKEKISKSLKDRYLKSSRDQL